jgi:hexosaminidase
LRIEDFEFGIFEEDDEGRGRGRLRTDSALAATWIGTFVWLWVSLCAFGEEAARYSLIPYPEKVSPSDGVFEIRPQTRIRADGSATEVGEYLAARLRTPTGYALPVSRSSKKKAAAGEILLTTRAAPAGSSREAYQLIVSPDSVVIWASDAAGLFYGTQTLLQLLPVDVFSREQVKNRLWEIPCVQVQDEPRFVWRGFLLDVARHFFSKEEVKGMMDLMALHKLNTLQLHLTDDQGWRVEIRKYPRLTQVGAWRKDIGFGLDPKSSTAYGPDGRYGGFYTQADVRELVEYGRKRQISLVPEIEMPGHSGAALGAYPELGCAGTNANPGTHAGVLCPGREEVFEFLQEVLGEVMELFPSRYIHIGGDEVAREYWENCPRCQALMRREGLRNERELESYFVGRLERFLSSHGRTLIGWSEIREGGLPAGAVIMDWIGGGAEAAAAGHDVVMAPTAYCYFDYYQETNKPGEPRAIGGYLPLRQGYSFEPVPAGLDARQQARILGPEGALWTEYIASLEHAQYMMFPRLCALSEVAWTPAGARNYDAFSQRLAVHVQRLERLGVNYRRSSIGSP